LVLRFSTPEDNWLCVNGEWTKHGQPDSPAPTTGCGSKSGLPNPASVHCEEVGGVLEIKNDASGGQVGFCILPDKSVCEEWALLRNECLTNSEYFLHLNIKPGGKISSPLKITGESGGGWFFEGSFPITIVDWDGRIIGEGLAKANPPAGGDWMTTNFVPFEAELTFTKPANPNNQDFMTKGAIIFKKDNPSGLSTNDKAYELPIKF
jgi:putative hemolysin